MFPDDLHRRGEDRLDNLMKAQIFAVFQKAPVPLSMFNQLNLANDLCKHSKINNAHRFFNLQHTVESHGMDPIQCLTLYFGKVITNEVHRRKLSVARPNGRPDLIVDHVLVDACECNLIIGSKKIFK